MRRNLHGSNRNGSIHTVVPGELLVCSRPKASIPFGHQWADTGGVRSFGAAYLAGLLSAMGVRLALCLDPAAAAQADCEGDAATVARAFLARGIRIVTLAGLCAGGAGEPSAGEPWEPWLHGLAAFSALAAASGCGAAVLLCGNAPADRGPLGGT